VLAAHAPVEAGTAKRPARLICQIEIEVRGKRRARAGQHQIAIAPCQPARAEQGFQYPYAHLAREMIVTDTRFPQGRFGRTGPRAEVPCPRRHAGHLLQHLRDVVVREAEIAVAALAEARDQPARFQFGEMRAGGLWGDAGLVCQLARRQCLAAHQRRQHVGAGRIARQRRHRRDARTFLHTSTLNEPLPQGNG